MQGEAVDSVWVPASLHQRSWFLEQIARWH
jgi:hypothetical protein